MSQGKRKSGKGPNLGPKSKKTRVTLPLYPDLNEDSGEVDMVPAIPSGPSNRRKKQQIKNSKTITISGPPLTADYSSEGDDDDDLADAVNDVVEEQEEVTNSNNISRRKTHPTPEQINRNIGTMPSVSSSESDSSDDDLQDLAAKHLGRFTGALPDFDTFSYGESITTPIDTQIPIKIQRKIWENKYIDLAVLLPNTSYTNLNANRRFCLEIGHNSKISLVPNTYTKKINSIEQWTTAFLRFAAIYGLKYPKEMSKLMKYAEIVRDLANRRPGLSWLMYDIQFRCLRQSHRISWDQLHTEFWVMAATTSTFRPQRRQQHSFQDSQFNNQPRPRFLRDTCWTYNRFGHCSNSNCHYEHKCGFCRGKHCAKSCQSNSQRGGPSRNGPDSQQPSSQAQTSRPSRPETKTHAQ